MNRQRSEPWMKANLARWDEVAPHHARSELYRVQDVLANHAKLSSLETLTLGDVSQEVCLHPMCHIGTDTILLSRLCTVAIGLDYSEVSINIAASLASQSTATNAYFLGGDISSIGVRTNSIDTVFLNWGSLVWIFQLEETLAELHRVLTDGGRLIIIDQHPASLAFRRDKSGQAGMVPHESYIGPKRVAVDRADYANRSLSVRQRTVTEARHTFADLVMGVLRHFDLIKLSELDCLGWQAYIGMTQIEERLWILKDAPVPLSFALVARKR